MSKLENIKFNLGSDSEKLHAVSQVLQEIGQKDKTYMSIMGVVTRAIDQVAKKQQEERVKEA